MTVCYRYTYPTAGTVQFKTAFRLGCSDCNYNFSAAYNNGGCSTSASCSAAGITPVVTTYDSNCSSVMNGVAVGADCGPGANHFVPGADYIVCYNVQLTPGCTTYICPVLNCSSGDCGCTTSLSANAGTDQTLCGSSSTTLSANNVSPSIGTWSVASGSGTFADSHDRATTVSGLSVGANKLVWSTSCGSTTKTDTVTITRVNTPAAAAGSNASICIGKSTTIGAASVSGSTYNWVSSPAGFTSTSANPTVTPTVTTTYTVTETNTTCTNSNRITITVNAIPTVSASSSSASICNNQTTATLTGTGANTYTWTPSASLNSSTGSIVTASPTSNTTYSVVGTTTATGCTNTATVTVNVNALPTVDISSSGGGSISICKGQTSIVLTASGANTYNWSPATGLNNSTSATPTATPTATTSYTVTGTTTVTGCTNTAVATVNVNTLPTIAINSAGGGSISICKGQTSIVLTASGANTYLWSPATGLSNSTSATPTATPTSTTSYTVVGTNTTTGCTNTAAATVNVNTLPTLAITSAGGGSISICQGQTSVVLTASGANTYAWSPATGLDNSTSATPTASPSTTTTYTVVGTTTASGCTNTATATVNVNPLPTLSISSAGGGSISICQGQTSVVLTASGANTYVWSPSSGLSNSTSSTPTATPSTTTTYTVVGTNTTTGCTNTAAATVNVNVLPTLSVTSSSASICLGQTSTIATATGANTYIWSPATGLNSSTGSTVTAQPTSNTQYTITGTNSTTGCTNTKLLNVFVNTSSTITITPSSTSICNGKSTQLSASGVSTYTWTSGPSTSSYSVSPTSNTTYTVTGTNTNGCTSSATAAVTVGPLPDPSVANGNICYGKCYTLTGNGANNYTWSTGATTNTITVCPTTTTSYTMTGFGTNGCSKTVTAVIVVRPLPTLVIATSANTICLGASNTLTVTGASTYTWLPSTALDDPSSDVPVANPTVTTNYTVTGTAGNGCSNTASVSIGVNPIPTLSISGAGGSSISICKGQTSTMLTTSGANTYLWSPASGLNQSTGSTVIATPSNTTTYTVVGMFTATGCTSSTTVTVSVNTLPTLSFTASDGTICYGKTTTLSAGGANSYSWQGGTTPITGSVVTASPLLTTLFQVTGTNTTSGCTQTATMTIVVNPLPTISISSTQNVSCKGLSDACIVSTANGGSQPYTYNWSNSLNGSSACGFTAGNYTLTVTDSKACSQEHSVTITEPTNVLSAVISGTITPVNCKNACNGTATVATSGGTLPYKYLWSNGQTASIANSLCAGTYSVIVTDNNSCSVLINNITITEPTILDLNNISATKTNCNQSTGSVSIVPAGGTPTYNYTWTPGNYASNIVTNLPAGTYIVKVKDANGCSGTNTVNINNFNAPEVGIDSTKMVSPKCFSYSDGSLVITLTGGASPFKYIWENTLAKDSAQSPSGTYTITNIKSGSYFISVIDNNNCKASINGGLITLTEPDSLIASVSGSITPVKCFGNSTGEASVTASGGTPLYSYLWSVVGSTTSNAGGLLAGTFIITVKDQNQCSATTSITITQPNSPMSGIVIDQKNVNCNNGSDGTATVSISGGTPAYTYLWLGLGVSDATADKLKAGAYIVKVTDANGCTMNQEVSITEPLPLIAGIDTSQTVKITCSNGKDGCLAVTAIGGTPNFTYNWSNGQNTSKICNLSAGDYTVTVTDANGCIVQVPSSGYTILVNPLQVPMKITDTNNGSICAGLSIELTASGPNVISYVWTPGGANTSTITAQPITSETYTVTGTDIQGCTGTASVFINVKESPLLDLSALLIDTAKCAEANGKIKDVEVKGGTPPFAYTWKDLQGKIVGNGKDLLNVITGNYTLFVKDANGCADSTDLIKVPSTTGVSASFTASPSSGDIPLNVKFTNTSSPNVVKYNWDFSNDSTSTLKDPSTTFIEKGEYLVQLIVEGPTGCPDTATLLIRVTATSRVFSIPNIFTPNGDGVNEIFKLRAENLQSCQGEIFNRWGERIFAWDSPNGGWDGGTIGGLPAADGTYYFIIKAIGMDGERYEKIGTVQLIR